ncbi:hypothetical protein [Streptomyces sp. NPDC006645]|uniref:hypothetical protein n=1 Tax=unclassified Streptomyces TaxID=2593676 RepID=UPI0033A3A894
MFTRSETPTPAGDDEIPDDKSPAERKAWWDGLSEERRREFLDIAPDLIGNLNGIPSQVRDEANRTYLPVLIDSLEQQSGDDARTKLDGLRAIEDEMNRPTGHRMYLLGIGDEGNGRAIVAYGNPDTSQNVHVPEPDGGFTAGAVRRALRTAIGARGDDVSSASIVWLGYGAPETRGGAGGTPVASADSP